MGRNPLSVIAECLGEPADEMRNPANAEYRCPFKEARCSKVSRSQEDPVPVCSIYRSERAQRSSPTPVCICPERFFEADIVNDVLRECWGPNAPASVEVFHEVQMEKFGTVDMVIAEVGANATRIDRFIPVELQAVDITGSYLPYYQALTTSRNEATGTYGFNWANVRKRFITQLVEKGYYCHHWNTRMVAVVQEDLFDAFSRHAHVAESTMASSNIVFLLYQFSRPAIDQNWTLRLKRVVPTTHQNVMQAILYERPPDRARFEEKLLARLSGP